MGSSDTTAETCPRCDAALPERANFCPNCGAPLVIPPASERRVVTAVFTDLADSTELAASLDPERFREVLAAFHSMVSDEVTWLGGTVESVIGDAVLGVFGTPVARDDDALRGIRAGMQIQERAGRLGRQLGLPNPLRVRVGINTGQVAVGTSTDRNLVIGAEVNAAARIQQAAAPGEVLIGATTRLLVRGRVELGERRLIDAKGFDRQLPVWAVSNLRSSDARREPQLVDRRRELTLLADTFDRVRVRERAHLVTLLGEPGIGKSRIVEEFLRELPQDTSVHVGRSSPFEEEVTYWPLAQMVYRELGRDPAAPGEDVLDLLRDRAAAWVETDEVDRTSRSLALALGLGEGDEENRYQAAEVRGGVLAMLTGLAANGPVVLVFEDLHEADPMLLDLVEQIVKEARRMPLLVVCVARWEFLEERPSWPGGLADAVTLWVEPLTESHAAQLAESVGDLDAPDAEEVARHAGGNPFFVVEIAAMLRHEERRPPRPGMAPTRLLPATVQAVIAARIDQLSPHARDLVRRASVFPRGRFELDELTILVDPKPEVLDEARDEEILVPDGDQPGRWRFRSDVLRDVAYESLAKRERRRLHLRVADELGSTDEGRARFPRTIAFHVEQAALAALDLAPDDRSLAERASMALAAAGDIARRRIESRSAIDLYARALALAGPEESWGDPEAWILSSTGEARYWLGEFDAAEESLRRALALGGETSDRVCAHASRFLADITLTIRGDDHLATALFDRSLEASRRLGDPVVLSRTLLMAAWVPMRRAELDRAETMFREALEVARAGDRRDAWAEARALVGIAETVSPRGDEREALRIALEGLEIGTDAGQAFTSAVAHETAAASLRRLDRLGEALDHAEEAIRTFRELGARWELAGALGNRGSVQRLAGRVEDAETDLREAFVLCRDLSEQALVTWTAAELSRVLALRGDVAEARELLDDPAVRSAEGEPGSTTALRLAEAAMGLAEGDLEAAERASRGAIEAESGERGAPNPRAAAIWWTGRLFGAEAAGGEDEVAAAQECLRSNGWEQALREPALVLGDG